MILVFAGGMVAMMAAGLSCTRDQTKPAVAVVLMIVAAVCLLVTWLTVRELYFLAYGFLVYLVGFLAGRFELFR